MNVLKKVAISTGALILSSGIAQAADVYTPDSLEDTFEEPQGVRVSHSGFYIKGDVGIANGTRGHSRTVNRNLDVNAAITDQGGASGTDDEKAKISTLLDAYQVPHGFDGDTLNIPLIADTLGLSANRDWDSFTFGGEVSYLYEVPNSRFGIELGLGATFYNNDADTTVNHNGVAGSYTGGTALAEFSVPPGGSPNCSTLATCEGDLSHFTQSGFSTVSRDYDIDLIPRLHYFAREDVSLYGGVGASWARFKVSGANAADEVSPINDFYSTSFNDEQTSLGVVANAGVVWWVNDYTTFGVDYTYKHHEFDVGVNSSGSYNLNPAPSVDLTGGSRDNLSVEDDIHAIKARLGFKLN